MFRLIFDLKNLEENSIKSTNVKFSGEGHQKNISTDSMFDAIDRTSLNKFLYMPPMGLEF